jgi:PKHD-type hydroxylase
MIFKEKVIFTKEEVNSILLYMDTEEEIRFKIKYDGILYQNGSKGTSKRLDFTDTNMWIFDKIKKWTHDLNMGLIWKSTPYATFRRYREGDFFIKHTDDLRSDSIVKNRGVRVLTIGVQLSDEDEYEGGDFLVWNKDKEISVNKQIGNAIMYSTYVPHEVKEIKKGMRTSLILFATDKNIKFNNVLL